MALVAFEDPLQTPLGHLVTLSQRKRTAEIVDEAILTHQHQSTGSFSAEFPPNLLITCRSTALHLTSHTLLDGIGIVRQNPSFRHSKKYLELGLGLLFLTNQKPLFFDWRC